MYSKKVDCLFHDCRTVNDMIKAFDAQKHLVDLPVNKKQAPLQAITLPETLDLDVFQDMTDVLHPDSGDQPMDEDFILHPAMDANFQGVEQNSTAAFQDPGPNNQTEEPNVIFYDSFPQDFPEIEVRRDAVHDISNEGLPPRHPDQRYDVTETTASLEKNLDNKGIHTRSLMSLLTSGGESMPFHGPPTSASLESSGIFFVSEFRCFCASAHESPQLTVQLSPPVQLPKTRRRPQRRKMDRSVKKACKDPSNLLQKRRKVHPSALAVGNPNNCLRREKETECLPDDQDSAYDNILHEFEPSPSRLLPSPVLLRQMIFTFLKQIIIPQMNPKPVKDLFLICENESSGLIFEEAAAHLRKLNCRSQFEQDVRRKNKKLCARMFYQTFVYFRRLKPLTVKFP
ncbi:hypothetical protein SLEP1_g2917 [Rubroshorea leprosula]|uniref:Uncharacterized protein n=1 Tax=Rubroshorea leprosula TaxID=152421 RepID=A0AAV5HPQ8_9ROSI|nr:hypothetical protein SLEP1_g2917 [Rubroshorea leprosula]